MKLDSIAWTAQASLQIQRMISPIWRTGCAVAMRSWASATVKLRKTAYGGRVTNLPRKPMKLSGDLSAELVLIP